MTFNPIQMCLSLFLTHSLILCVMSCSYSLFNSHSHVRMYFLHINTDSSKYVETTQNESSKVHSFGNQLRHAYGFASLP